jgi:DNA repair ATPase RecN
MGYARQTVECRRLYYEYRNIQNRLRAYRIKKKELEEKRDWLVATIKKLREENKKIYMTRKQKNG